MAEALVFGGSGQIGAPLLQRLLATGWRVHAVSRQARADGPGLRWVRGDLAHCPGLPARVDAIFSCGPLDHFGRWYAASELDAPRVIAFGSTSAAVKQASADPDERGLAQRLASGEQQVFEAAAVRGARATLLRPTLVYGAGRDRTVARFARFATRWRFLPLPRGATGLRQPVHVEDLAIAALATCQAPASFGQRYDLPGGETLPFRDMVARTLAALPSKPRLVEVPAPVFAFALRVARSTGRGDGVGDTAVSRLREDLVFDPTPARRDFGYAPRPFAPDAAMFSRGA